MTLDIDYDTHPDYGATVPPAAGEERDGLLASFQSELNTCLQQQQSMLATSGLTGELNAIDRQPPYPDAAHPAFGGESPLGVLMRDGIVPFRFGDGLRRRLKDAFEPALAAFEEQRAGEPFGSSKRLTFHLTPEILLKPENKALISVMTETYEVFGLTDLSKAHMGTDEAANGPWIIKKTTAEDTAHEWSNRGFDDGRPPHGGRGLHVDSICCYDMKAILYLTEVEDKDAGAFQYCVGSHRDSVSYKDLVIRNAVENWCGKTPRTAEQRRRFMTLPAGLRRRLDFGVDLPEDSPLYKRLLEQERTYTSPETDAILFDTRGVHRGGYVMKGERTILQLSWRGQQGAATQG